jgi:hypothetical protein
VHKSPLSAASRPTASAKALVLARSRTSKRTVAPKPRARQVLAARCPHRARPRSAAAESGKSASLDGGDGAAGRAPTVRYRPVGGARAAATATANIATSRELSCSQPETETETETVPSVGAAGELLAADTCAPVRGDIYVPLSTDMHIAMQHAPASPPAPPRSAVCTVGTAVPGTATPTAHAAVLHAATVATAQY